MPSLAITLHLLTFLTFAIARPTTLVARNQSSTCAQFDSVTSGPYAIQNDIWGATSGGGQSQCSQITSFDGTNVAWTSQFSWSGAANSVKTYANAEASSNTACKALSQYNSIKTSWQWRYVIALYCLHVVHGTSTDTGEQLSSLCADHRRRLLRRIPRIDMQRSRGPTPVRNNGLACSHWGSEPDRHCWCDN